jgi:hypothetical protein
MLGMKPIRSGVQLPAGNSKTKARSAFKVLVVAYFECADSTTPARLPRRGIRLSALWSP